MDSTLLRACIRAKFSEHVGLTEAALFGENLTLSAIIHRSERLTNSVDLMEAFARTANALRKAHGVRVRLPTLSLDTPISTVLEVFMAEAAAQQSPQPAARLAGGM